MFIAILNPIMSFLIEHQKKGDTINIRTLINYIQSLDNQEHSRMIQSLDKLKGDEE